jgi:hypothetical protein
MTLQAKAYCYSGGLRVRGQGIKMLRGAENNENNMIKIS